MGKRLNRTVKNWRWWVMLPLVLPVLPVVVIDLLLAVIMVCAELALQSADDTRDFLRSLYGPFLTSIRRWATRSLP